MMAFPGMLVSAAEAVGMKCPSATDADDMDMDNPSTRAEYPHFVVFCLLQLCRPIQWGEHWGNAKAIAAIPEDRLKTMTLEDFREAGVEGLGG